MTFNLDDYEPVATRLSRWLENTDGHTRVITDMVHRGDGWCVFRAELWVDNTLIATGWAEEHVTDRGVNSTSHVENCETSAIGRALAAAGFGGTEFASANEVQNAIHQQSPKKVQINSYVKKIEESANVEELKANFKEAFGAAQSDAGAIAAITVAKDKRKSELAA